MLVPHFRSDSLANVFEILFYVPILLCLPVLLVGLVFVFIPGGFIIVLGGLYYALVGFIGLLGRAASRRRWSGASRVAPNLELSRPGLDDINVITARERGHAPDRQDGAQAA